MWKLHNILAAILVIVAVLLYFTYDIPFIHQLLFKSSSSTKQTEEPHNQPSTLWPPNPQFQLPPSTSPLHEFAHAAVCSDNEQCSEIGTEMLQRNGSAVDASIATLLCNGLVTMQSMGLGGGMLMTVYVQQEKRAYSILAREVAPLNLSRLAKMSNTSALFQSTLSIAVPTEVAGYAAAHERFGRLPWSALVQPTVWICHSGYKLSQHQLDALYSNKVRIMQDELLRQMFVDEVTGEFRDVNAHIQPPKQLCRTYELLAEEGPNSFYKNGTIANRLAADLRDLNSTIDARDLRRLRVSVVPAVESDFGADYRLHLPPPPGSGHIIALISNILQRFEQDFRNISQLDVLEVHRIVEAFKFAFVQRWQLDVEATQQLLFNLTCPKYAATLSAAIDDERTYKDVTYYGGQPELLTRPDHGTAHISVLAANGDAAAATSSINFYFGSGRMGARTGILLNNAIGDFAIDGLPNYFDLPNYGYSNTLHPGQSPMSSMCPVVVSNKRNGDVRLVTGAAGGTKIISVLTQVLVRVLWMGQDIKQAIDGPRFHHQMLPNVLEYEFGQRQQLIEALEVKGHQTYRYRERGSAVCGIERNGKHIRANADYRKEGNVQGY